MLVGKSTLRILFWGTRCEFSAVVFAKLLQHARKQNEDAERPIELCGVMIPATRAAVATAATAPVRRLTDARAETEFVLFDAQSTPDLLQLAQANAIPTYEIGNLNDPKVAEYTHSLAVDVVCVACYPKRVPTALLAIPRYGFLNVHPSLLPAYRGPAPLFWMMRDGAQNVKSGITVHWMDDAFDTGPIAAQQQIHFPDGIHGPDAERACASAGAELLVAVLDTLQKSQPASLLKSDLTRAQDAGGSYHSWPHADNFAFDRSWTARRAFNFISGTKWWGHSYMIELDGQHFVLIDALAFDEAKMIDSAYVLSGDVIEIQLAEGTLRAVIERNGSS